MKQRSCRIAGLWAAAVVTAALIAGCTTGTSDTATTDPPTPAQTSSPSPACPVRESSDGARVEVADSAVTTAEDDLGDTMASYAVMLTNPSADIALATDLEIRLLDEAGNPVKGLDDGRTTFFDSTVLIMPGQQQAVTNRIYVEDAEVASIDVTVKASLWLDAADDRLQPVTVTDVSARPDGDGALIDFAARSPHPEVLKPVAAYAVFRDASGRLLGGSSHIDAEPREYQPGDNRGEIDTPTVPAGWDPVATEVYVSSTHHLSMVACQ